MNFIDDLELILSIFQDYSSGMYRKIPFIIIATILAMLFYLLAPYDMIPGDLSEMEHFGYVTVVAACLAMVEADLHEYKDWKIKNSITTKNKRSA